MDSDYGKVATWIALYQQRCATCKAEPWHHCHDGDLVPRARAHPARFESVSSIAAHDRLTGIDADRAKKTIEKLGVDLRQLTDRSHARALTQDQLDELRRIADQLPRARNSG